MDFKNLNREELISELQNKTHLLEHFVQEKQNEELLNFAWSGNLRHWYWDVQNNSVEFNELKIKTLGYVEQPIGFEFFTDKLHPEDYERVMQNMRDLLSILIKKSLLLL